MRAERFAGGEWGGGRVRAETVKIAERIGVDARVIGSAHDVDAIDDLRRLARDSAAAPLELAAPLRRWLHSPWCQHDTHL